MIDIERTFEWSWISLLRIRRPADPGIPLWRNSLMETTKCFECNGADVEKELWFFFHLHKLIYGAEMFFKILQASFRIRMKLKAKQLNCCLYISAQSAAPVLFYWSHDLSFLSFFLLWPHGLTAALCDRWQSHTHGCDRGAVVTLRPPVKHACTSNLNC